MTALMESVSFTCACGHKWTDLLPVQLKDGEEHIEIIDDVCSLCGCQCDVDDDEEE